MKLTATNTTNLGRPPGCSCTIEDVTAIGDAQRTYMPVQDPMCRVHGLGGGPSGLAGKTINTVILDEALEEVPEVECVRCNKVTPLKSSSWLEHDYRAVGWWCQGCRIAIGADVGPNFVTIHTPTRQGASDYYEFVKRNLEQKVLSVEAYRGLVLGENQ